MSARILNYSAVIAIALLAANSPFSFGDDWPNWFGPTHDAVWHEEGVLDSFAETGPEFVWRVPVNKGYSGPSVADGRVFLTDRIADEVADRKPGEGIADSERCLCFDAKSGVLLWTHEYASVYRISYPEGPRATPTVEEACYSPPLLVELNNVRQLIYWNDVGIDSVRPESGEKLWSHSFPKNPPQRPAVAIVTPRLIDDKVLVSDFYNGSLLLKLKFDPIGADEIWASGADDQEHKSDLNTLMGTPVIVDDHIYGIAGNGEMRCVKMQDQSPVWRDFKPSSTNRPACFATSFIVRNHDRHFLYNDQGELKICLLSPAGFKELASAKILKPTSFARGRDVVWSHPAFADRRMFARNDEELVCVDLAKNGAG